MFLRAYRREDKRHLQQLFYDTVHTVCQAYYTPEQLHIWAPSVPDRDRWASLDHEHCFVVESNKIIVGFAAMTDGGVLSWLYVHTEYQGRGIATALLRQVERLARKRGLDKLNVEILPSARRFFERNGFLARGENPAFSALPPLVVLEKKLPEKSQPEPIG